MKKENFYTRSNIRDVYNDIYTSEVLSALSVLSQFNNDIKDVMLKRIRLRDERQQNRKRMTFMDPDSYIPMTSIKVQDARDGRFEGAIIPADLQCQWIQGTGPGAKPNAPTESSIRNVSYALLSGADGWMFDGEDALGQINNMSLDNQRNLKLAIAGDPLFLKVSEQVANEMNSWAVGFLGKKIIEDWRDQLGFTTKIFRARGLHLDDRHVLDRNGRGMAASIVDIVLYIVNNYRQLINNNASLVLYLPKIQTAEEAAIWNMILKTLEDHLGLAEGTIKCYVLVEQLEATFQLMEIRAVLGKHFVGYNTGRWDYINSVSDAMRWDKDFINPNIESIIMTYGYMRNYEDRVRRAVNTPDINGNFALWQGWSQIYLLVQRKVFLPV
jgi:malate synthase